jgi:hypothetical protein
LTAQNADLHKTIDNLNACFLTFTDDLVASGWLEQEPQVTKSLQRTIEHFITVVQSSHTLKEDNPTDRDDDDSGSATTESPVPEGTQDAAPLPVNESTITISGAGMNSSTMMIQDLYTAFITPHKTTASEYQFVRNNAIYEAPNGPTSFQTLPYEFVSAHNNAFNYKPRLPKPVNLFKRNFAQKLHMEAIRAGLRLVCTAEDSSQLFYEVFDRVLDFPTRESYRVRLSKILDDNFNHSLQPPPESDFDTLDSGGQSCVWLNASDVASHFRSIGVDIDSSLDVVNGEINPRYLPNIWTDMQDLPAKVLISRGIGGFADSQHQQLPHDEAPHSSTAYYNFTEAAQDASIYEICSTDAAYGTRGYGRLFMSVDVSKLIRGKYIFSPVAI